MLQVFRSPEWPLGTYILILAASSGQGLSHRPRHLTLDRRVGAINLSCAAGMGAEDRWIPSRAFKRLDYSRPAIAVNVAVVNIRDADLGRFCGNP